MSKFCKYLVLVFIAICAPSQGANILFYHGAVSSYSHHVGLLTLTEGLVARGHNVTYFSPFKYQGKSFVHEFCASIVREHNDHLLKFIGADGLKNRLETKVKPISFTYLELIYNYAKELAESDEMIRWIRENKFDLVFIDSSGNEIAFVAAYYWNAKVIVYNPHNIFYPWHHNLFSIPDESSWLPQADTTAVEEYGFLDRLSNFVWTNAAFWVYDNLFLPKLEEVMRKRLVADLPPLAGLIRSKTELIFANSDCWDQFARPLPPFVLSVSGAKFAGFKNSAPLTEDMEEFLARGKSKDFIYISFGTTVKISSVRDEFLKMFLETLAEIDMKFLLKCEGEAPKFESENILIRQWFPQTDVLGHKHIRGFVTQGGQNSLQQGVYHGVPMIVIPLFGDQDIAGKFVVSKGVGKLLEFSEFTAIHLKDSIQDILFNKSYAENSRKLKEFSRQVASDSLKAALDWTERVVRGDDLSHLKPPSVNQPWWVYRSLDVLALIFFVIYMIIFGLLVVIYKQVVKFVQRGGMNLKICVKNLGSKTKLNRKVKTG